MDANRTPGQPRVVLTLHGIKRYGSWAQRAVVIHLEGPEDIAFVVLEGEHELRCGHNRVAVEGGSLPNTSLERTRER